MEEDQVFDNQIILKLETFFNKIQISPYNTAKVFLILTFFVMLAVYCKFVLYKETYGVAVFIVYTLLLQILYQNIEPIEMRNHRGYLNLRKEDNKLFRIMVVLLTIGLMIWNIRFNSFFLAAFFTSLVITIYEYLICLTYTKSTTSEISKLWKTSKSKQHPF